MRVFHICLLVASIAASAHGEPSTQPTADSFAADIARVGIHLQYFTPEKNDFNRSLDISVVRDDESTDAEGLMHADQAKRVLKALENNHFFERAHPMAGARWGPQTQPFYILSVDDDGPSVYEKLPIDLKTGKLLVAIREALGKGPAGLTIDRYAGEIDPGFRRWKDKPATLPTADMLAPLPPAESKLHPGHRFDTIDPQANLETTFIQPDEKGGHWIAAQFADAKACYVEAAYRLGTSNTALKRVTYYPSGKVFAERDCHATYIDMLPPKGDEWERRFAEDGTIVFYAHWHDDHCVDGFSRDDGHEERVDAGKGSLTRPEIGGGRTHLTFDAPASQP